jgi:hypothetical protein
MEIYEELLPFSTTNIQALTDINLGLYISKPSYTD